MRIFNADASNGSESAFSRYTIYDRHLLVLDSKDKIMSVMAPGSWGIVDGGTLVSLPAAYVGCILTGLEENE